MLMLDTADVAAARELKTTGLFSGVTTNPTILKRAGRGYADIFSSLYEDFHQADFSHIFFQVVGDDASAMTDSGMKLRDLGADVIVKVPATFEGYRAVAALRKNDVPVLLTAVYHSTQALAAAELGCWGIAPYAGRLKDLGKDPVAQIGQMASILAGTDVRILAASLRSPRIIADLAAAGVGDFTMGVDTARALIDNPHSMKATADFMADHRATEA